MANEAGIVAVASLASGCAATSMATISTAKRANATISMVSLLPGSNLVSDCSKS
ncbi:MAG: hypothetical protein AVDCRST_MAG88-1774 [uncultured Thermomicrobiales bacterium]|uniref:Uncharacterized protein n=1 Tax=uncultured Thermomicrobiales bacterium TaxID=1645740 RepID=A0A6J4V0J1_9BACT|nr:MAG: hypothetical protein AVDCRST_MAG88-1774 [uncultured Thermomicrobiales bacterium]